MQNFLQCVIARSGETINAKLLKNNNRYETRAFLYLDFPSWLESKVTDVPVEAVIRKKFLERMRKMKS